MTRWKSEKSWYQEDYERIKEALPEDISFNGPGNCYPSEDTRTFEIDAGNRVSADDAIDMARRVSSALEADEIEVAEIYFEGGYRGATNVALIMVVEVYE